jgi:bla regulator protein blaR1
MTPWLALALYAVGVGVAAPSLLRRLGTRNVGARLEIAAWLTALASMLAAALLAGVAAILDADPIRHAIADFLHACADAFHIEYAGATDTALAGAAAAVLLTTWLAAVTLVTSWRRRSQRRRHTELLDLVGRRDAHLGATVLEHERAAAYCLPGSGGRIVVTSSLLDRLTPDELAAVLAHERAHLAGRHHLLIGLVHALSTAAPFVPLCQRARVEVPVLLEQLADEAAAHRHEPDVVASALLRLADAPAAPGSTLAAGGPTAASRALRLLDDRAPASRASRLLAWGTVGVLTLTPLALFAVPAIALSYADHCPLPLG